MPPSPAKHHVHVKKVNANWKVVPLTGSDSTLRVHPGDDITLTAIDSDLYLQFPDANIFKKNEYKHVILKGTAKTVTLKDDAELGRYVYAAFCMASKDYADGNSPPVMIIE